jgi:hypothetical protein
MNGSSTEKAGSNTGRKTDRVISAGRLGPIRHRVYVCIRHGGPPVYRLDPMLCLNEHTMAIYLLFNAYH